MVLPKNLHHIRIFGFNHQPAFFVFSLLCPTEPFINKAHQQAHVYVRTEPYDCRLENFTRLPQERYAIVMMLEEAATNQTTTRIDNRKSNKSS